tara:strand:+ start:245 stop:460 length:216 start_codon:yes stop_codon:yes gene_type:complete
MSTESTVGRRIFELKDFVKERTLPVLIETLKEINVSLNDEHADFLIKKLGASIDASFDLGINNVLSAVRKK